MKSPMLSVRLELWDNPADFLEHGRSWIEKLGSKLFNPVPPMKDIVRGLYCSYGNRIILFTKGLEISSVLNMRKEGPLKSDYHRTFALQFYFTLVHEIIHALDIGEDFNPIQKGDGHLISKVKMDALPIPLREILEGLFQATANDAFSFREETL